MINQKNLKFALKLARYSIIALIALVVILWIAGQLGSRIWPADSFSFRVAGVFANKAGTLHNTGFVYSDVIRELIVVPCAVAILAYIFGYLSDRSN